MGEKLRKPAIAANHFNEWGGVPNKLANGPNWTKTELIIEIMEAALGCIIQFWN